MYQTITATYTDTAVQVARDIVKGYTGEYIFFQTTPFSGYEESYELIMCDRIDMSGNYNFFECYADTFYSVVLNVDADGALKYWYIPSQANVVEISNSAGALFYSSLEYTPQLVEGGEKYGYLQTCILCGCVLFYLVGRIFRRVAVC